MSSDERFLVEVCLIASAFVLGLVTGESNPVQVNCSIKPQPSYELIIKEGKENESLHL